MTRRPHVSRPFLGQRDPRTRRKRCCLCGNPVGIGRVNWCGENCAQRYLIAKGDQNACRRWLWRVDQGICQLCLVDTVEPEVAALLSNGRYGTLDRAVWPANGQWEADHTIPICEGGDLSPENLRTLCISCHRAETRKLRRRRADQRLYRAIAQAASS